MSKSQNELLSQQAIVRFRLAHSFPVGSEATFSQISETSGLPENCVRQIIRHAVAHGIFVEPRRGFISHNAVSRLLAEDSGMHDWVGVHTDEIWQASAQTCNALAKWPMSEEPNQTGFSLANQSDKSMYEILSQFPERAQRFGNSMNSYVQGAGYDLAHIVDNWSWDELGSGTVVDVGGSEGFVCLALARKFPSLSFVVQDIEPVIEGARKKVPADVADRVEFMAHDFFTEQPVVGADVYLFRWIMHNWSDKYCVKILRCLIPALKPGAKIIVNDNVLPQPGEVSKWKESRLRNMDLTMREIQNSHERELEDWEKLFKLADPSFDLQVVKRPVGSNLWILVAEWKGA